MTSYLNSVTRNATIIITQTVDSETRTKIWDLVSQAYAAGGLPRVIAAKKIITDALLRYRDLCQKGRIVQDDPSQIDKIRAMYATIWADRRKGDKVLAWGRVKRKRPTEGPPSGPDLVILSTASALGKSAQVELLTFDHDFILFSDEIQNESGVVVFNAGVLS